MSLYSFYRISKPSEEKIASEKVEGEYKRLRGLTFWGVTGAYALYYVCRMAMSVVKQPLIDEGIFTAAQLGIIGSAFYFVYAFGKFTNGFIADYCNVRRFMATGLLISTVVNLLMGVLGLLPCCCSWSLPSSGESTVSASLWGHLRESSAFRAGFHLTAEAHITAYSAPRHIWVSLYRSLF